MNDDTGFISIPARYDLGNGIEAIDYIRSQLGDEAFYSFCIGNAMRYRLRMGKKGPEHIDQEKLKFYEMMAAHIKTGSPDPRANRQ
jgi:hypothetical protein